MLPDCQFKVVDLYTNPIGNVKRLVPNLFDKENYVHIMKTSIFI